MQTSVSRFGKGAFGVVAREAVPGVGGRKDALAAAGGTGGRTAGSLWHAPDRQATHAVSTLPVDYLVSHTGSSRAPRFYGDQRVLLNRGARGRRFTTQTVSDV